MQESDSKCAAAPCVVDAVIPTFAPDEKLILLLNGLSSQQLPLRTIHIINTDRMFWERFLERQGLSQEDFERKWPQVRLNHIRKEDFDHGKTRNQGVLSAEGADYVLLMTQDAVPADSRLTLELEACFESDPLLEAAYGRQLPSDTASAAERYTRSFNYPQQPRLQSRETLQQYGIKTYFCSNVCALYSRSVLLKMGGFPEQMIFNEDMVQAGRAVQQGWHIRYTPEAKVCHSHDYTARQQFQRNFDMGVSQADHPEIFSGVSSEGEGIRYVKAVIGYLLSHGAAAEIPVFIFRCAARLTGYRLGRNYRRLSHRQILKYTGTPHFWEGKWKEKE